MSLADKCIVVGCFVCWDYDKILMETGKFSDYMFSSISNTYNGIPYILVVIVVVGLSHNSYSRSCECHLFGRIAKQFRLMDVSRSVRLPLKIWLTFALTFWNLLCNPDPSSEVSCQT